MVTVFWSEVVSGGERKSSVSLLCSQCYWLRSPRSPVSLLPTYCPTVYLLPALLTCCPDFETLPFLSFISFGPNHFNSFRFLILFPKVLVTPFSPVHCHRQVQRVGRLILQPRSKVESSGSSFSISLIRAEVRFSRPRELMWIKWQRRRKGVHAELNHMYGG